MFEPSNSLAIVLFLSLLIDITVGFGSCPTTCVSCTNDTCMKCEVGNYLESGLCYTCPENCTSCNNSVVCYNCTEGYYGLSCEKDCTSLKCFNSTCDKDSGACLHGCIEGYFQSGPSCYPCSANCKTCANFSNNCLECKDGHYGSSCQYPCSHCKDGICSKDNCTYGCGDGFFKGSEACNSCNDHCINCSDFYNCHFCKNGFFGQGCQYDCGECSLCNKDGTCPATTNRQPTLSTESTSPSKQSVITSFQTTTISTTADRQPTITKEMTSPIKQPGITSFQITTISITTDRQPTVTTEPTSPTKQSLIASFQTPTISTTTDRQPTITTKPTSPSKQSLITSFQTTTIATTTDRQPTMKTEMTRPSNQSVRTSFHTTITATTTSSRTSQEPTPNNTLIFYAAVGGGGGLFVIVLVIVVIVVCNRRGRPKQSDTVAESIDMTENENYISADDIDGTSRNATNAQNTQDAMYALPDKMHRPTMITIDTRSITEAEDSQTDI